MMWVTQRKGAQNEKESKQDEVSQKEEGHKEGVRRKK